MTTNIAPQVGMDATISIGTDRYPATVVRVTKNCITVTRDRFSPDVGHDYFGTQKWKFSPNTNGVEERFWINKTGRYQKDNSYFLHVGKKVAYMDPGF